ncbi:hypothetical protein O1611_g4318 [Lasiodiplodia mahajangana]|uniref:Uncharacterized protein n=1 Tax=Lasiodiplodia mahajangana TaxID=1108764 RepID=A0ACC2JPA4_9PEZI|nr:hypothetical protein O1611_g4318 [Lasiodiplodia mahajangana]
MRSSTIFGSVLAFSALAFAQVLNPAPSFPSIYFPRYGEVVVSGNLYHIEWNANELVGPATLYLMGGDDASTLQVLSTIAHVDVNKAEYRWAVDCSIGGQKPYLIKLSWDGDNGQTFGVSPIFYIQGPNVGHSNLEFVVPGKYILTPIGYPFKPTSYPSIPTAYTSEPSSYQSEPGNYPTQPTTVIGSSNSGSAPETTATDSTLVILTPTSGSGNSMTLTTPIPTAGAVRAGASLGLGLLFGALVL